MYAWIMDECIINGTVMKPITQEMSKEMAPKPKSPPIGGEAV